MLKSSIPYKPVSALRLTLIVTMIVSIVFPLLFAYINDEMTSEILARELLLTPLRLGGITMLAYGIIQFTNSLTKSLHVNHWRYFFELPLLLFLTYWWLYFVLQAIEAPMRHVKALPMDTWVYRQYIGLFLIASVFIFIFQSGLNFYKLAEQKAIQAENLQKEFARVRLQALKSQVNPHFLFNSLSVLSSLVHVNAALSEQFIIQLSKAYRYILEQKELDLVTLKNELEFLDAYFFLLQIRFANKIALIKEIDPEAEDYKLPPLTVQLLVENAVKHNKMSTMHPLKISLKTIGEKLLVANNLNARQENVGSTGIGIENIKNRYAMVTDRKINIEDNGVIFIATIPLLK